MSLSKPNRSAATLTVNRVTPVPSSGICVTCVEGCEGPCEIGRSALKGEAAIYPLPFGAISAGAEKDYPVDFSHFNIQGTCVGAVGIEPDPDKATFPAVDVTTEIGSKDKIKIRFPAFAGALGSTEIARKYWDTMAIGAAICGTLVIAGENICGMDPEAEIKNGRIVRAPEMEKRINLFKRWCEGYGDVVVQLNVEDTRLGVAEYVVDKLGVDFIELKWGQGAKNIGGEVKLPTLERALQLKRRGYIVLPDPENPSVQEAFKRRSFKEFERHSRLGMVSEEAFLKEVERLRSLGVKFISLKTGAYRPADLARAVKFSSEAKIDLLTVDGAGGGTGMSPWRMMNEWGIPTVYIESLLYNYCKRLKEKGEYIPTCAIAGGLSLEDHIFKALALGAPYVKLVCMGRAIMTAAMVAHTHGRLLKEKVEMEGEDLEDKVLELFSGAYKLKQKYGDAFAEIPPGAIGMYTYFLRLKQGLQQLMAGARKFALKYISREDLMALTREASEVSGIPYLMDADAEEVEKILG